MKKSKVILVAIMFIGLLGCGGKYSIDNLKKDEKFFKETMEKCNTGEIKSQSTACKNVKKIKRELAQKIWNQNKDKIEADLKVAAKHVENGELQYMFELFPEKVLAFVTKSYGITEQEFKEGITSYAAEEHGEGKLIITRDFSKAKPDQTSTGRTYAVVPFHFYLEMNGKKYAENEMKTLMFEDEGKWYVINIDNTSIPVLQEIYPDLKEVRELQRQIHNVIGIGKISDLFNSKGRGKSVTAGKDIILNVEKQIILSNFKLIMK